MEWIVAQSNRSGFVGLGKIASGSGSRTLQAGLGSGLDLALVGDVLEERRLGSVGVHDDQRLGEQALGHPLHHGAERVVVPALCVLRKRGK